MGARDHFEWRSYGAHLLMPDRSGTRAPARVRSARLNRMCYRRDMSANVFSQRVERCAVKRVWARDPSHLHRCVLRKALKQMLVVLCNSTRGNLLLLFTRVGVENNLHRGLYVYSSPLTHPPASGVRQGTQR